MDKSSSSDSLLSLLLRATSLGQRTQEAILLPTILVRKDWLPLITDTKKKLPVAERVLNALRAEGFLGDRTRKNLYGYPRLFRELFGPPPWTCIEPEEIERTLSEERESELRPLYVHCLERGAVLLEEYRAHLLEEFVSRQHILPKVTRDDLSPVLADMLGPQLSDLADKVNLALAVGRENLENIYDALFEPDLMPEDFEAVAGTPDLFVWHPDAQLALWFFAEVKGPGDRLRPSQTEWIRRNWERVQGRVVLVTIDGAL